MRKWMSAGHIEESLFRSARSSVSLSLAKAHERVVTPPFIGPLMKAAAAGLSERGSARRAPSKNNWNSRRVESELCGDNLSGSSGCIKPATPQSRLREVEGVECRVAADWSASQFSTFVEWIRRLPFARPSFVSRARARRALSHLIQIQPFRSAISLEQKS